MNELENFIASKRGEQTKSIMNKFETFFSIYSDFNSKINVSSIKDKSDVFIKHFLDSIYPMDYFKSNCADIGCGGGFPCVPLCIVNNDVNFTAIDSVNKKLKLIDLLKTELNLNNITTLHSRAEDIKQKFDIVTARAVAPFEKLFKYCLPLVKSGGLFIAYKSQTEDIPPSYKNYNFEIDKVLNYKLPNTNINRSLIIFKNLS